MTTEGQFTDTLIAQTGAYPGRYQPTPLQAAFMRLVTTHKDLQRDYEHIGFINTQVYANSCRALAYVEEHLAEILVKLYEAELAEDWAKHLGHED